MCCFNLASKFLVVIFVLCLSHLVSTVLDLEVPLLIFLSGGVTDTEMQEHYDEFFEEVFTELEDKVCTASVVHWNGFRTYIRTFFYCVSVNA